MISSREKMVFLSGTLFGSIFIFTSLDFISDILLRRNGLYYPNNYDNNYIKKLIAINGITMAFSGFILLFSI